MQELKALVAMGGLAWLPVLHETFHAQSLGDQAAAVERVQSVAVYQVAVLMIPGWIAM
jgi:hypothetical protein